MPLALYVRFPGATWVEDERLGAGIAEIKPIYLVWALDEGWTQTIERHGFTIASEFSGKAHSFQGANLEAAIADCNEWTAMSGNDMTCSLLTTPSGFRIAMS